MSTQSLSFNKAKAFEMRFGPFDGMNLDAIAQTDNGLKYLDHLRAKVNGVNYMGLCLEAYLDDPTISKELAAVMEKAQR